MDLSFSYADGYATMINLRDLFTIPLRQLNLSVDGDESPPPPIAHQIPNLAVQSNMRHLDLSLSGRWIGTRAMALAHRLRSLSLDLCGGMGLDSAAWMGMAAAVRSTAGTLQKLSMQLAFCDLDDETVNRLIDSGIQSLSRIVELQLDVSNNPLVSDLTGFARLPPSIETLRPGRKICEFIRRRVRVYTFFFKSSVPVPVST